MPSGRKRKGGEVCAEVKAETNGNAKREVVVVGVRNKRLLVKTADTNNSNCDDKNVETINKEKTGGDKDTNKTTNVKINDKYNKITSVKKQTDYNSGTLCTIISPSFFLIKSEPGSRIEKGIDMKFSIEDLMNSTNSTEHWDGVRNYQARNILCEMKCGDKAFFYHSNCKPPGIVGVVSIVRESYTDHTQFIDKHPHFDPNSPPGRPRWKMVDVKFERKLKRQLTLDELKKHANGRLCGLPLLSRARLSVQRVSPEHWQTLLHLEEEEDSDDGHQL
eukprot:GHVS01105757.1.p1 GENE.GHVS01105757.1~~GHVS01105757.1.p1  ORF type:complete len:276 (+),score=45.16 GHVS01105757.1:74-901(+)